MSSKPNCCQWCCSQIKYQLRDETGRPMSHVFKCGTHWILGSGWSDPAVECLKNCASQLLKIRMQKPIALIVREGESCKFL